MKEKIYSFINLFLYLDLPRNIQFFAFAKFIDQLGSFVTPILILFLSEHLDFNPQQIGYYLTVFFCLKFISNILATTFGDTLGRRRIYFSINILSSTSLLIGAFSSSAIWVLIFISVWSILKSGSSSLENALVVEASLEKDRKRCITYLYMVANVARSFAPILGVFLYNNFFKTLLTLEAVSTLIACFLIWKYCHEEAPTAKIKPSSKINILEGFIRFFEIVLSKKILPIYLCVLMFNLVYTQYQLALPLFLNEIYGSRGNQYYGYLLSLNCVFVFVISNQLSLLVKKYSSFTNIMLGGGIIIIGFSGHYWANHISIFFVLCLVWTIGELILFPNFISYVSENVDLKDLGKGLGMMPMLIASTGVIAPVLFGFIMGNFGIRHSWSACAIIGILALSILFILKTKLITVDITNNRLIEESSNS